jgi:hypothetical protein
MTPPSAQPPDKPQYDPQVLLNSQLVMITVIDPELYKVLFQNHGSITTFGDMSNLTCYKNIAGCAIPCSFCKMPETVETGTPITSEVPLRTTNICWPTGRRSKAPRTAPQPNDNLDNSAEIDGASESVRSPLHAASESPPSHSCLCSVGLGRCCRCGSGRLEEGGGKLVRMASSAAPSLTAPLAPCTVLKPVLQFFGLV